MTDDINGGDVRDVVVVGGGLAGAKTAEALRTRGFDGSITVLGDETELPYERPPLSKGYLAGDAAFDKAVVHAEQWYRDNGVTLRRGERVTGIDRETRAVHLAGGGSVTYDALVLATGAEPRRLPIPGADTALTLRSRADSDAIRAAFGDGRRLAVVGAGWIGLEVAAAARKAGTAVTVLEAAELPLLAVLGPEMAGVFAALHRDHGVDLRLGARITGIEEAGVRLAGGELVGADAVVLGVGVRPRTELAEAAGLDVEDGVLVDACLRTSDPRIVAVGDIASHDHPDIPGRVRVEHWANALNQPATAAATVLGHEEPYDRLPYFFTDQYDLGMEYVGYVPRGADVRVVTRGDVPGREFVAFWVDRDDRLLASMNVNVWDVVDAVRPAIGHRVDAARLADPGVPYAELAGSS